MGIILRIFTDLCSNFFFLRIITYLELSIQSFIHPFYHVDLAKGLVLAYTPYHACKFHS